MKDEPSAEMDVDVDCAVAGVVTERCLCCANTVIQTRNFPSVEVFPTFTESESEGLSAEMLDNNETATRNIGNKRGRKRYVQPKQPATKGFGLRVSEPVSSGTILVEYLGEVITSTECLRRMKEYTLQDAFYFAGLDNGLMLDAKVMGSVARFANHSCSPTCALQKWNVQGECRLVLVSLRDLLAGEEVSA